MSHSEGRRFPVLFVVAIAVGALVLGGLAVSRLGDTGEVGDKAELSVSVSFPTTAAPGDVATAAITVTNSGSADVKALFVSFSLVGGGGEAGVVEPLVEAVAGEQPSIVAVRPPPDATGGGMRYGFGRLAAGDSTTVEFDLRVPESPGTASNSVQVYDGSDPDVATGARLTTEVG
ncbi:MAG: hypothetical protein M3285_09220 [Actinomycetota bacterium]|nr:hypothetical protein [Actinomycetota bacterium]